MLQKHVIAGLMAASVLATPFAAAAQESEQQQGFAIHSEMRDDPGLYARDTWLAYIKTPNENFNRMIERGLLTLLGETYRRTSIEPAGIVGLDVETDDLSFFPFIYWPVIDQTSAPSPAARERLREASGNGVLFAVDSYTEESLRNSEAFRRVVQSLAPGELETVESGHLSTQTFYIIDDLPGMTTNDVFVELVPEEQDDAEVTAFVFGEQHWAQAWDRTNANVGPDVTESAIRAGINMLFLATMGAYKNGEIHEETINAMREYQRQHEEWERQQQGGAVTPDP